MTDNDPTPAPATLPLLLLPCPFCGEPATFEQLQSLRWSAGCENADCIGYQSLTSFSRKCEAATAWNRRTPAPAPGLEVLHAGTERLRDWIIANITVGEHTNYGVMRDIADHLRALDDALRAAGADWEDDAERYRAINTPEIHDFIVAVEREALHQRERWASDHDAGKTDADWFWLIGYLAGKAINKPEKKLHHIITTAAACLNWHAQAMGASQKMRPGIGPDKQPPLEPTAMIAAAPPRKGSHR